MIETYIPEYEDLWFKQQMMSDGETMSYNHAYGGTIPFPKERWRDWYSRWIDNTDGSRFYRYLKNDEGNFVGEFSYRYDEEAGVYMADIVIFSKFRRKGYGSVALEMLCKIAKDNGISVLYDEIASDNPSIGLFLKNGFEEQSRSSKTVILRKVL